MLKARFFPVIFLAALSYKSRNESGRCYTEKLQNIDTSHYAVVKYDDRYKIFNNATPATISTKEIDTVLHLLNEGISKYNNSIKRNDLMIRKLHHYNIQLVPVLNIRGEKEVSVNGLCDESGDAWKHKIIYVFDGGNCYFNTKINLTTKKVYEIGIHGFA
jgi:hypothetical protein